MQAKVGFEIVLRPPERLPLESYPRRLPRQGAMPFKSARPVALRCRAQGIGVAAMSTDVPPVVWLEADAVDLTTVLAPMSAAIRIPLEDVVYPAKVALLT